MRRILYIGSRVESALEICRSGIFQELHILAVSGSRVSKSGILLSHADINCLTKIDILPLSKNDCLLVVEHKIAEFSPDLIISVGFPYILPVHVCERYSSKLYNLHPHILPERPGWNPVKTSHENGEILYGATLHRLTPDVDAGQKIVEIRAELKGWPLCKVYEFIFGNLEPSVMKIFLSLYRL